MIAQDGKKEHEYVSYTIGTISKYCALTTGIVSLLELDFPLNMLMGFFSGSLYVAGELKQKNSNDTNLDNKLKNLEDKLGEQK